MLFSNLTKAAVVVFATSLIGGGALAQQGRQDQVQDRVQDTNQRINHEYREGDISRGQARELKRENNDVRHEEQAESRGGLSRGDQHMMNRQENGINRQIDQHEK